MRKNDRNIRMASWLTRGRNWFVIVVMLLLWQMPLQAKAQDVYRNTNDYRAIIEDKVGVLSEAEIEKLTDIMKPITEYGHVALVIESNVYGTGYFYALDYAESQWGPHSKGIVVLMDMKHELLYIDNTGAISEIITTARNEALVEEFRSYCVSGDYDTCAFKIFEQIGGILSQRQVVEPMRYIGYLLLALISSMIIMYYVVNRSMKKYSAMEEEWLDSIAKKQDIYNFSEHYLDETKKYVPGSSRR